MKCGKGERDSGNKDKNWEGSYSASGNIDDNTLAGRTQKIRVEIETSNVMGGMSSREAGELDSGVGVDGVDSDKRRARSIGVGR